MPRRLTSVFTRSILLPLFLALGACHSDLLNPAGDVAVQQRDLLIRSTLLMLLIIIPVMALTIIFAWRYRASNKAARYEPDWDHSTQLELVIWSAPLLIIICLGALTWLGTHLLDPYRSVNRIAADQALLAEAKPLQVEVVALDWKWLFIYPEYGVATVNELALPVNRPLSFRITSTSVMNSFYIPALAGQVYAMPGMQTQLHGVLNKTGDSQGFSANYSGAGFSGMRLTMRGMNDADFNRWLEAAKANGTSLTRDSYLQLAKPSEREPVHRYATVDTGLFQAILNRCVEPNKMCTRDMMAIDARGGQGLAGIYNVAPLVHDKFPTQSVFGASKTYVVGVCKNTDSRQASTAVESTTSIDDAPLVGAGLSPGRFTHNDVDVRSALL